MTLAIARGKACRKLAYTRKYVPPQFHRDPLSNPHLPRRDPPTSSTLSDGKLHLKADTESSISRLLASDNRGTAARTTGLSVPSGEPGIPPILKLADLLTAAWKPEAGIEVPVFGVETWDHLTEGIRLVVTPRESGEGEACHAIL